MGQIGAVGPAGAWYPEPMQEPATHTFRVGDLVRIRDGAVNNMGMRLAHGELALVSSLDAEDTLWDTAINTAESTFVWTSSKHLEVVHVTDEIAHFRESFNGLARWIADYLTEKTDARTAEISGHEAIHLVITGYTQKTGVAAGRVERHRTRKFANDQWADSPGMPVPFMVMIHARPPHCTTATAIHYGWEEWVADIVSEAMSSKGQDIIGKHLAMERYHRPSQAEKRAEPVEQANKREARAEIVFGGARSFPQDTGFKVGEWVDLSNKDDTGVRCWLWRLMGRPPGSQSKIIDPTAAHPSRVLLDVPGEYAFVLMVNDGHGPRRTQRKLIAMGDTRRMYTPEQIAAAGAAVQGEINAAQKAAVQREKLKECIDERGRLLDVLIAVGYTAHSGETAVTAAIDLLQGIAKLVWEDRGIKRDDILINRIKEILVMWDEAVLETKKLHEKLENAPGAERIAALERDCEVQRQRIQELATKHDACLRFIDAITPRRVEIKVDAEAIVDAFARIGAGQRRLVQISSDLTPQDPDQIVQAFERKTEPRISQPLPAPSGCFRRIEITSKDGRPRTRFWYARHDGTAYIGGAMPWAHESGETMTIEGQPVDQIVMDGSTARITVRAGSDGG